MNTNESKLKICYTCKKSKPLCEFNSDKNKKRKDGRSPYCSQCSKERQRICYQDPKVRASKSAYKKRHYLLNKEKVQARNKRWAEANRDKISARSLKKYHEKVSTSCGRISTRLLTKIRKSVNRIGKRGIPTKWPQILGYTFEELKTHLESKFLPGMTWEKLLNSEIEIDHIVPRCSFYYETVEDSDFKECWSLKNLQPLWANDNRAKRDIMPDGTSGRKIGEQKIRLLNEELYVAGYESHNGCLEEVFD